MERSRVTRRRFIQAVIAEGIMVTGCSRLPLVPTKLPEQAISANPFDYCKPITSESSLVAQAVSGLPVPTQEVEQRAPVVPAEQELPQIVTPDIVLDKSDLRQRKFQATLIPVGFEDPLDPVMVDMQKYLHRVFRGVNISFPYLAKSLRVGVNRVMQYSDFSDRNIAEDIIESLKTISMSDLAVFLVDTNNYIGTYHNSGKSRYILASPRGRFGRYSVPHEIGHGLGLVDGYRAENLGNQIPGEALFSSFESLPQHVKDAYFKLVPEIVPVGAVCTVDGDPQPLYTFYATGNEKPNLMKSDPISDTLINKVLAEDGDLFDPMQKEIMNIIARRTIMRRRG